MENLSSVEILVVLLVALVVLGPSRLPHAVQQAGRFIGEVRRIGAAFRREVGDAIEEPIRQSQTTLAAADPRNAIKQAAIKIADGEPDRKTSEPDAGLPSASGMEDAAEPEAVPPDTSDPG